MDSRAADVEALKLLAGRELPAEGVRTRLQDRGFTREAIEEAIARLTESGAIDDRRFARAYARTAVAVKGRGRLRVQRELHQLGVRDDVAAEALGEVFADFDERSLIGQALQKRLHGRAHVTDAREIARLYQYLMRQGFSPAGVSAALRRFRGSAAADLD